MNRKSVKSFVALLLLISYANSFMLNTLKKSPGTISTDNSTVYVIFNGIYPDDRLNKTDKIYMRGDNCNLTWTSGVPLKHGTNNTWSTMLACPTGVGILIKLVLNDKVWMLGPNYWFVVNARSNLTILPSFFPSINKVYDTESISSSLLKNSRKCSIYLPPSYHDNPFKKYELIFMHDGQNLFEDSKAAFGTAWKIQDTLNDLIGRGEIN